MAVRVMVLICIWAASFTTGVILVGYTTLGIDCLDYRKWDNTFYEAIKDFHNLSLE